MDDLLTLPRDPVQDVRKWKRSSCVSLRIKPYLYVSLVALCTLERNRRSLRDASFILQVSSYLILHSLSLMPLDCSNKLNYLSIFFFFNFDFFVRNFRNYLNSFGMSKMEPVSHGKKLYGEFHRGKSVDESIIRLRNLRVSHKENTLQGTNRIMYLLLFRGIELKKKENIFWQERYSA